jgi:hypothetical protein
LAFVTQPAHGEAFWRCLSSLRGRGIDAALFTGQKNDAPPWSLLAPGGRWKGILLCPQDPMAIQWQIMARQLGIAVGWMPKASQEAWGS